MALSIMTLNIMALSIMTLSIMSLSIMPLSIMPSQHNVTQLNNSNMRTSGIMKLYIQCCNAQCHYAEFSILYCCSKCRYAECHFVECRGAHYWANYFSKRRTKDTIVSKMLEPRHLLLFPGRTWQQFLNNVSSLGICKAPDGTPTLSIIKDYIKD